MLDFLEQLKNTESLSILQISILLIAGFLVGIINTLAGSGTIISYSVFMFFGVPANFANGTIRLGVIMQTFASSWNFFKHDLLNIKIGLKLGLPILLGAVLGAQMAVEIDQNYFERIVGVVILFMVFLMLYKPEKWIKETNNSELKQIKWWHFFVYFLIGIYGGFIHIGVGLFLIAALVLVSGYDLVRANGLKVFTVFLYSPFALLVYMLNNQINYKLGLIAAIGNLFGGILASRLAVKNGANFVRWFVIVIALLYSGKLFRIYA